MPDETILASAVDRLSDTPQPMIPSRELTLARISHRVFGFEYSGSYWSAVDGERPAFCARR